MKNGYQQFFKKAQQVAAGKNPAQPASGIWDSPQKKSENEMLHHSTPNHPKHAQTQKMQEKLRDRIRQKGKKSRVRVPWRIAGVSVVGIILTFIGLQKSAELEKYFKHVEISFLGYAAAEDAKPSVPTENKTDKKEEPAATAAEKTLKKEFTEEEINHFAKLNERKMELDAREEELNRMETELATQKADLEKRMQNLENARQQISSVLDNRVQADDKKVDALVQVYSNMKPSQAAKVFETMDEDLAIEILGRMKKKPAAEILNLVKAEKAQTLSEKYTGYKRQ